VAVLANFLIALALFVLFWSKIGETQEVRDGIAIGDLTAPRGPSR
jgi:hypothetical protein